METLIAASQDKSEWTRTETIWGLGLLDDIKMASFIVPALDDPSALVVNEAILSLHKVTSEDDMPLSSENMTEKDREQLVDHWKKWWHENKYQWGF